MARLAVVLWCALEHPERYPFIIMLAETTAQASINMATVQHELRENELIGGGAIFKCQPFGL